MLRDLKTHTRSRKTSTRTSGFLQELRSHTYQAEHDLGAQDSHRSSRTWSKSSGLTHIKQNMIYSSSGLTNIKQNMILELRTHTDQAEHDLGAQDTDRTSRTGSRSSEHTQVKQNMI